MISIEERDTFLKNLRYISVLHHYNSERPQEIERFFLESIKSGDIFKKTITLSDIIDSSKARKNEGGMGEVFKSLSHIDLNLNIVETYITYRYMVGEIAEDFRKTLGFYPKALYEVEITLNELISSTLHRNKLNEIYKFKSKSEYGNMNFIVEPPQDYLEKIPDFLALKKQKLAENLLTVFTYKAGMNAIKSGVPYFDTINGSVEVKEKAQKDIEGALSAITIKISDIYDQKETLSEFTFYQFPLIEIDENMTFCPFVYFLGKSTIIRIENLIAKNESLRSKYDNEKGSAVETIVPQVFRSLGTRNLLKNVKYKSNGTMYESDAIVCFEDTLWDIEVKTHSILRHLWDYDFDKIRDCYVEKVAEAYEQGCRMLDYMNQNEELVRFVGSNKKRNCLGVIVVVDSFIPNLYHHNARVDDTFGTQKLHQLVQKHKYRLSVFNLIDILTMSLQPEADNFEEFVLWRTSEPEKFPVSSTNERELWAFKFDFMKKNPDEMKGALAKAIQNDNVIIYTSARFNRKDYLDEIRDNAAKEKFL